MEGAWTNSAGSATITSGGAPIELDSRAFCAPIKSKARYKSSAPAPHFSVQHYIFMRQHLHDRCCKTKAPMGIPSENSKWTQFNLTRSQLSLSMLQHLTQAQEAIQLLERRKENISSIFNYVQHLHFFYPIFFLFIKKYRRFYNNKMTSQFIYTYNHHFK